LAAVFAFGFDGIPLERRESAFPARLFTLPVPTAALVGVPMLAGVASMALAWLAWAGLVLQPNGVEAPLLWPVLALAAGMAWLQAMLWTPQPVAYGRLGLLPLVLGGLATLPLVAAWLRTVELVRAAAYAVLLPPAYGLALVAVSRSRRGDVWSWEPPPLALTRGDASSAGRPFASADDAQLWYEWRTHGLGFPVILAAILLGSAGMLGLMAWTVGGGLVLGSVAEHMLPFSRETCVVFAVYLGLVFYPPFLASAVSADLGAIAARGQSPAFMLARPLGSDAVVRAKLRMAARSLALVGVVVVPAAASWLLVTGTGPVVAEWWRQVQEMYQPWRAWAMAGLAVVGVVGLTWLQLCKGLASGALDRNWARWLPVLSVAPVVAVGVAMPWLRESEQTVAWLRALLPWVLGVVVCLKLGALAWVLSRAFRHRLWTARSLGVVLGVWAVTAGCLFVVAGWLLPEAVVPAYQTALGVVAVTPVTRLVAAPVVLDWVRHR
jgi:hypothetical protein